MQKPVSAPKVGRKKVKNKLKEAQVLKAVNALLTHLEVSKSTKRTKNLLSDTEVIALVITLRKIPEKRKTKPQLIPLPHPLFDDSVEICIISPDPGSKYKTLFQANPVPGVKKVLSLSKLRANYKQYEAKRRLCASYDLFLVDKRILSFLPALLGRSFFEKKKIPVPVKLDPSRLKEQIQTIIHSTFLHIPSGVSLMVKIGKSDMTAKEIVENIMAAVPEIVTRIPKKWKNIQSISFQPRDLLDRRDIKAAYSVALPIYTSLPDALLTAETTSVESGKRKRKESEDGAEDSSELQAPEPKVAKTTPGQAATSKKIAIPTKPQTPSMTPAQKAEPIKCEAPLAATDHTPSKKAKSAPAKTTTAEKSVKASPKFAAATPGNKAKTPVKKETPDKKSSAPAKRPVEEKSSPASAKKVTTPAKKPKLDSQEPSSSKKNKNPPLQNRQHPRERQQLSQRRQRAGKSSAKKKPGSRPNTPVQKPAIKQE